MRNSIYPAVICLLASVAACGKVSGGQVDASGNICEDMQGSVDSSIAVCTALLADQTLDNANRARLHFFRGLHLERKGELDNAIMELEGSVRLAPDNAFGLANRGILLGKKGELKRALADLDAAIRLDPDQGMALGNRAIIHEKKGDFPLALADLNRAIQLDPADYHSWSERCWIRAVMGTELKSGLSDCNKALERKPDDWNTYNSRGLVNYRLRRFDDAIADYEVAIKHDPSVASSFLIRGLARRAGQDVTGADEDIAKAKAMDASVVARYSSYGIPAD